MEIEVGEYVRIVGKFYTIDHINADFDDEDDKKVMLGEKDGSICFTSINTLKQLKHSKNIIDLIQEGDYVNGHLVVDKYKDTDDYGNDFITIEVESDLMLHKSLEEKHIKSIVAKEQFSSVEYLLEED